MGKTIERILPVLIVAGAVALGGCNWYKAENIGMTRQEHIRADCLEKYKNGQTRSYLQCVITGYDQEVKGR